MLVQDRQGVAQSLAREDGVRPDIRADKTLSNTAVSAWPAWSTLISYADLQKTPRHHK